MRLVSKYNCLGYGDKACIPAPLPDNVTKDSDDVADVIKCEADTEVECGNIMGCVWDYTGLGMDYQVGLFHCPPNMEVT